jgi:mono/diheme cytochrome c family protein
MAGRINRFVVAGAFAVAAGAVVATQERSSPTPSIRIDSLAGRDSFDLYCASCHGTSGRGDGTVAPSLRTRPADLTTLAQRNDGAFLRDRVRASLTGADRSPAAHGTADMPVWGPLLRAFESDARVRVRIENLIAHVESLQQPPTGVSDPGAQAFRTYCASCHGASGRGNGPVAAQLRTRPPDLTKFTTRNGGVFPLERVTRLVDGGGLPAHGSLEMPVWGDAFRAGPDGLSADEVRARIDAIVRFLQGIQERPA